MKRMALAAVIGVAGLLLIMLGLGPAGSTLPGSAALAGSSATESQGLAAVTSARSGAVAAPPTPRRVGRAPALPRNNISVQEITIANAPGAPAPGPGRHPGRGDHGWPARRRGH